MVILLLEVRGEGGMGGERVNTWRDQGTLAEMLGCTAAVSWCVAWSFWLVELCRLGSLSISSIFLSCVFFTVCSLFIERDSSTVLF